LKVRAEKLKLKSKKESGEPTNILADQVGSTEKGKCFAQQEYKDKKRCWQEVKRPKRQTQKATCTGQVDTHQVPCLASETLGAPAVTFTIQMV
jgi:hypothetical protein